MNLLKSLPRRLLKIIAALFTFLLGVVLLPLPGPGMEVIGASRIMLIQALPFLVSWGEKIEGLWYKIAPPAPPVKSTPLRKNNSAPDIPKVTEPDWVRRRREQ